MAKVIGLRNGGTGGVNPKDKIGATKIDLTVVSQIAIAHCAFAMMDGADKYGEYNWRVEPILARTYVAAAMRHLGDWLDGQDLAEDSLGHHLGHAMACCAILLDAIHQKQLVDDRPVVTEGGETVAEVFDILNERLRRRNENKAKKATVPIVDYERMKPKPLDVNWNAVDAERVEPLVIDKAAFLGTPGTEDPIAALKELAERGVREDTDFTSGQQEHQEVLDAIKEL